jgi:hypothetical protein
MGRWRLYAHEQATRTHRTRALKGQMHGTIETRIRQIGTRAITHRTVTPYRDHRTTIIDDTNRVNDATTDRHSLGAFSHKAHIHPRACNTQTRQPGQQGRLDVSTIKIKRHQGLAHLGKRSSAAVAVRRCGLSTQLHLSTQLL